MLRWGKPKPPQFLKTEVDSDITNIRATHTHTKARLLRKAYNPMLAVGGHQFASSSYGAIFVKLTE
ncbi:hypothetical protein HB779_16170 [Phyllobacterium sp. 628]|uniref:hypothetical protein n=1 Tax=Phyllobacterium sp. 628 TaxID=2718938 RepID=UPI00166267C0|nr:hypothetical protein [Phyllobacterium sp. 628]QND53257.1 hypothetical protein HB779_16170 [Phyllobacterium sp. 628]